MRHLRTQIDIDAPVSRVWAVLIDTSRWQEWNPLVTAVQGTPVEGAALRITVQLEGRKPIRFKPRILRVEPNRELRWVGTLPLRLFVGEHFMRLEPLDDRRTRFLHGEDFSGLLLPLLWPKIGAPTERGYHAMNHALKQRCESP